MSKKATEKELSDLHRVVAMVLKAQVQETMETEEGDEVYIVSPALIGQAIKFLKDNDITCDIENDENMSQLKELLSNKPRYSDAKSAAREFDNEH